MDKIKENTEYWYFNTTIPSHLPKLVKTTSIHGQVVMFNTYVSNEQFADINVISSDLFNNENDALIKFTERIKINDIHFVNEKDIDYLKESYPEMWI